MAKVRYTGTISGVSGTLGDEVHSHHRKQNIVKKKTKKKYKKTKGRVKVMESFGRSGRGWGSLTEVQMDAWDRLAPQLNLKSLSSRIVITKGYILYNYVTLNLHEIGEEAIRDAPPFHNPDILMDVRFEYVKEGEKRDLRMYFSKPISENTRVIIKATGTLSRGQRYVDESWYKKIGVIGSEFMSGDSILARYLQVFKEIDETQYKIHFEIREVSRKSGVSNFVRPFKMVL